jgi:hypothetical protein
MFTVIKAEHSDFTGGHTALTFTNIGNSRYKGTTTVWVLVSDDFPTAEDGLIALYRKKDAEAMAAHFNKVGYDGSTGDPMMVFQKHLRDIEDWDTLDKIKEV